jgi:hypothetical protein
LYKKGKEIIMNYIKRLTFQEALGILDGISEDDFIGHGSSRAVYSVYYQGKECVMKIALDRQGRNQNVLEMKLYAEHADSGHLADIYARYSNVFMICEKVTVYDEDFVIDVTEYGSDAGDEAAYHCSEDGECGTVWESYDFRSAEQCQKIIDDVREVYNFLCEYQGDTSDNCQIGCADNGKAVAYDYGYDTSESFHDIVGRIYRWVGNGNVLSTCYNYIWENDEMAELVLEFEPKNCE